MSTLYSEILSPEEVQAITGYEQPKRQVGYFLSRGIPADRSARNMCIVRRSDYNKTVATAVSRPQVKLPR